MTILVDDMDIYCLMVFYQQIKESKIMKGRVTEKKRSRSKRNKCSHDGLDGHGHSKN